MSVETILRESTRLIGGPTPKDRRPRTDAQGPTPKDRRTYAAPSASHSSWRDDGQVEKPPSAILFLHFMRARSGCRDAGLTFGEQKQNNGPSPVSTEQRYAPATISIGCF